MINQVFAKKFHIKPEKKFQIPKINKRTGPNKRVKGGSLVKINKAYRYDYSGD